MGGAGLRGGAVEVQLLLRFGFTQILGLCEVVV